MINEVTVRGRVRVLCIVAVIACVAFSSSASAQDRPAFELSIGVFPTTLATNAQLDSTDGDEGSDVDLEDDLGLKNRLSNLKIEGNWRFKPNHRVEFGYTYWNRNAEKSVEREFTWGDAVFDAGASVRLSNDAQFFKAAYRYSLINNEKNELSLSFGVDALFNKTTLEGEATITGPDGTAHRGFYESEEDFVLPIPLFGADYHYSFTKDVSGRASAEYLQFDYNDITTKVLDARVSFDYTFTDRWGAGVGYNFVGLEVERNRFQAEYDFQGALLYMTFRTQ